jgi:AraC-like DNA-binding protein
MLKHHPRSYGRYSADRASARFAELAGRSPMAILRELRMRGAAQQLKATDLSVDQVARNMGYTSRSSFVRAFRKTCGSDPADYHATGWLPSDETASRRPTTDRDCQPFD